MVRCTHHRELVELIEGWKISEPEYIIKTMDTRPIGIFDSGVGGLSVFREIRKLLPKENYIFVADQKNVPYGGKSKYQLRKISDRIVKYLIKRNAKMIVVACNTASCYAIDFLRKKYPSLLLVGTIPAIKTAAELSRRKSIAVLSTPATAKSSYIKELIRKYADGVTVTNIGCPDLEDLIERGMINSSSVKTLLKKYLEKALIQKPDYIVLGCTHYPFLKSTIQKLSKAKTVDSGRAIAKRVENLLSTSKIKNNRKSSVAYLTTGNPEFFSKTASQLLRSRVIAEKLEI